MTDSEQPTTGSKTGLVSRRQFFRTTGVTLATVAVASAIPTGSHASQASALATSSTPQQSSSDIDILNFALTLEHLEAEFYKAVVATGVLTGSALTTLTAIREHEIAHVKAITDVITQLGGTPVAAQDHYNFGDISTQASILMTAETLEATGVGAYTGQAALITDKMTILAAAGSIEQVESRHYAAILLLNGKDGAPSAFGPVKTKEEVLAAIQPYLGN